ncbi:MAG: hypothetical protein CMH65_12130 [Nevskiales bacterium]|nr:hypothetical protein [Nevskiales bacterium]
MRAVEALCLVFLGRLPMASPDFSFMRLIQVPLVTELMVDQNSGDAPVTSFDDAICLRMLHRS